ncbi:hypothetical protein B4064_2618 [Caldibacillus thermoamylovorans]|nr:hypothetical protein B4064_2618 [Caldibacillus thermoamylovorans]
MNISERDSHKEIKNSGVGIISIFLQILAIYTEVYGLSFDTKSLYRSNNP